jgi:hypothetical protein
VNSETAAINLEKTVDEYRAGCVVDLTFCALEGKFCGGQADPWNVWFCGMFRSLCVSSQA